MQSLAYIQTYSYIFVCVYLKKIPYVRSMGPNCKKNNQLTYTINHFYAPFGSRAPALTNITAPLILLLLKRSLFFCQLLLQLYFCAHCEFGRTVEFNLITLLHRHNRANGFFQYTKVCIFHSVHRCGNCMTFPKIRRDSFQRHSPGLLF